MKTKLFLAAVAVTFSFAVISCSGNKANNAAASEGEEATVETVETVAVEELTLAARLKTLVLLLAIRKLIAQKRRNAVIKSNLLI